MARSFFTGIVGVGAAPAAQHPLEWQQAEKAGTELSSREKRRVGSNSHFQGWFRG